MTRSRSLLEKYSRIGLFDSGVGGLSVLRHLAALPGKRDFVYLGDTARCPYGNRDAAEITMYVDQIVRWLLKQDVEAIVMACNTSAAIAYNVAQQISSVPVYDLISPTALYTAALGGRAGVMATASTARSRAFSRAIKAVAPQKEVVEYGCPDLVPLIESGNTETSARQKVLQPYVQQLAKDGVKELILGCTHFPFLRRDIESLTRGKVTIIDPAEVLSGLSGQCEGHLSCRFYVTGDPQAFARAASVCLEQSIADVQVVSVEQLTVTVLEDVAVRTTSVPSPVVQVVQ